MGTKIICPECKSNKTVPILYGYPAPDAMAAAMSGEIMLGGCVIDFPQADRGCLECGYKWSKQLLPGKSIKKVRYKVSENGLCAFEDMKTWVYEFFPDGKCVKYVYRGRERHYEEREIETVPKAKISFLYNKIQKYMSCDLLDGIVSDVCDGCSYQLNVTYLDGRSEVKRGDVGMHTYEVPVEQFIEKVFYEYEI